MARPAPGSLAARSDLRNRLNFFRKPRGLRGAGEGGNGVGEVTIEIEGTIGMIIFQSLNILAKLIWV